MTAAAWRAALSSQPPSLAVAVADSTDVAIVKKSTTLSQLLAGVAQAVAQAFKASVWTLVEVVDVRLRNGHAYIEVSERVAFRDDECTPARRTD